MSRPISRAIIEVLVRDVLRRKGAIDDDPAREVEMVFDSDLALALKHEIVAVGRKLWERQYVDGNGGNISYRLTGDWVLCTPTLMSKGDLRVEDICLVDFEGHQIAGVKKRTSEILMHLQMMKRQPKAVATVHCHPPYAKPLRQIAGATRAPLVVKPVDGWAARGVVRLLPGVDLAWAHRVAVLSSPSAHAMVEIYTAGRQLSVMARVGDGTLAVVDVAERCPDVHERFAPFVLDAGHERPVALTPEQRDAIDALLRSAVAALGSSSDADFEGAVGRARYELARLARRRAQERAKIL